MMSFWQLVIAHAVPTIAALAALIVAIRNLKKTEEVKIHINSRMDELLKLQRAEGHAAGVAEERDRGAD